MTKNERYYQEYLTHRHVSRRGLFRAFVTASRNVAPPSSSLPPWPLPPGALAPAHFLATCTQCQQCVDACPMGVLISRVDGFPQLAMEFASCDGCAQCIQACTTGALQSQAQFDTRLRPSFTAECTHATRGCSQCVNACPVEACRFNESGMPVVNTDRCNGCGECMIQCDRQAVTLTSVG